MMKARLGVACLGVATSLLFAACGNGPPAGEGGGSASGGGGGGGDVGTKEQATSGAATVTESDALKFNPGSVSVKVGDVVVWDNKSSVAHNVTFDDYQSISSDTQNGGDTYAVKFTKAGSYQYHCTFHPGMDGTVTVG